VTTHDHLGVRAAEFRHDPSKDTRHDQGVRDLLRYRPGPLTISNTFAGAGPPRTYARLRDIRAEVADARVWAGLHFRNSMQEGYKLARKVAWNAASQAFLT
jgi:hypothetical protein